MDARNPLLLLALLAGTPALAAPLPSFNGDWSVDLRTPEQAAAAVDCGKATLRLQQRGRYLQGRYEHATAGCERREPGGEVVGQVTGQSAVLEIRSSRNGAVIRGRAVLRGNQLFWQARNIVVHGDPAGDELVLSRAVLSRDAAPAAPLVPMQATGTAPVASARVALP